MTEILNAVISLSVLAAALSACCAFFSRGEGFIPKLFVVIFLLAAIMSAAALILLSPVGGLSGLSH